MSLCYILLNVACKILLVKAAQKNLPKLVAQHWYFV